jgi:hypothetical protein
MGLIFQNAVWLTSQHEITERMKAVRLVIYDERKWCGKKLKLIINCLVEAQITVKIYPFVSSMNATLHYRLSVQAYWRNFAINEMSS